MSANLVCPKCGSDDFSPKGACRACLRVATAKYRKAHPEKIKAANAKAYLANPQRIKVWAAANVERIQQIRAARYLANAEKEKQNSKNWIKANPERRKQKTAEWKERTIDKRREASAAYRKINHEKIRAQQKAYRLANSEFVKKLNAEWKNANPHLVRIYSNNRRARKKYSGEISRDLTKRLYAIQKGKCPCCSLPLGKNFHLDHVVPLALGGANTDDNMQLLRRKCNLQKGAKHPIEFMQSRGFLL